MDKHKIKSIRGLILFTAAVILGLIYSKEVWNLFALFVMFLKPFIIGGAIAFVINILMRKVEKLLFSKANGRIAQRVKRPVSILLSVLLLLLIITLVFVIVLPQVVRTLGEIGMQIPVFLQNVYDKI